MTCPRCSGALALWLRRIRVWWFVVFFVLPAAGIAAAVQERISLDRNGDYDLPVRWTSGRGVAVEGRVFGRGGVAWLPHQVWRTRGIHFRTPGSDDAGVHRFFLNAVRYEYSPLTAHEGLLYSCTVVRTTLPEDAAHLRRQDYTYPFPDVTPAARGSCCCGHSAPSCSAGLCLSGLHAQAAVCLFCLGNVVVISPLGVGEGTW